MGATRCRSLLLTALLAVIPPACASKDEPEPPPSVEVEKKRREPDPPTSPAFSQPLKDFLARLASVPAPSPTGPMDPREGERIYREECDICHGPHGEGNGPLSGAIRPHAANLAAHSQAGSPTDGERFTVIAAGIPETKMQSYAAALSQDEIWHVVTWLRQLTPVAAPAAHDPGPPAPP